jgi:hypothetical protein
MDYLNATPAAVDPSSLLATVLSFLATGEEMHVFRHCARLVEFLYSRFEISDDHLSLLFDMIASRDPNDLIIGELLVMVNAIIGTGNFDLSSVCQVALAFRGSANAGRALLTPVVACVARGPEFAPFLSPTLALLDDVLKHTDNAQEVIETLQAITAVGLRCGCGDEPWILAEHCLIRITSGLSEEVTFAALEALSTLLMRASDALVPQFPAIADALNSAISTLAFIPPPAFLPALADCCVMFISCATPESLPRATQLGCRALREISLSGPFTGWALMRSVDLAVVLIQVLGEDQARITLAEASISTLLESAVKQGDAICSAHAQQALVTLHPP